MAWYFDRLTAGRLGFCLRSGTYFSWASFVDSRTGQIVEIMDKNRMLEIIQWLSLPRTLAYSMMQCSPFIFALVWNRSGYKASSFWGIYVRVYVLSSVENVQAFVQYSLYTVIDLYEIQNRSYSGLIYLHEVCMQSEHAVHVNVLRGFFRLFILLFLYRCGGSVHWTSLNKHIRCTKI